MGIAEATVEGIVCKIDCSELRMSELWKSNTARPFESQCIPTDPNLLTVERYKAFLTERRRLIAERLNTFLGGGQEA